MPIPLGWLSPGLGLGGLKLLAIPLRPPPAERAALRGCFLPCVFPFLFLGFFLGEPSLWWPKCIPVGVCAAMPWAPRCEPLRVLGMGRLPSAIGLGGVCWRKAMVNLL